MYWPATSPTNLPSFSIKPDAVLLLSKDLPVKENLIGASPITTLFLSYATALNWNTSPVLASSLFDLSSIYETGFFFILRTIELVIPSNSAVKVDLPDVIAFTLFKLSILIKLFDDVKLNFTSFLTKPFSSITSKVKGI